MVGISVGENESIDKALRRFKKKYERSGVLKEYKKRTFFVKPSVKKRMEKLKALRRSHRQDEME
ncbi:MAG: 30S ribosomal protein S21 [Ignavibacteria bacterium RBG_16_34_14]|nr:MAG: 30S ribosomal protein S21 [Ignavibacteria bacterium RBG_16_34_14]